VIDMVEPLPRTPNLNIETAIFLEAWGGIAALHQLAHNMDLELRAVVSVCASQSRCRRSSEVRFR